MRTPDKKERLQIPLMFAFRDAFEQRDATKKEDVRVDGERVVADRSLLRRRGTEEALLKRDLAIDLGALVDTINLASATDLDGLELRQEVDPQLRPRRPHAHHDRVGRRRGHRQPAEGRDPPPRAAAQPREPRHRAQRRRRGQPAGALPRARRDVCQAARHPDRVRRRSRRRRRARSSCRGFPVQHEPRVLGLLREGTEAPQRAGARLRRRLSRCRRSPGRSHRRRPHGPRARRPARRQRLPRRPRAAQAQERVLRVHDQPARPAASELPRPDPLLAPRPGDAAITRTRPCCDGVTHKAGSYIDATYVERERRVACRYRLGADLVALAAAHREGGVFRRPRPDAGARTRGPARHDGRAAGSTFLNRSAVAGEGHEGRAAAGGSPLSKLTIDTLPLHLIGNPSDAAALYEQLFANCRRITLRYEDAHGDPHFMPLPLAGLAADRLRRNRRALSRATSARSRASISCATISPSRQSSSGFRSAVCMPCCASLTATEFDLLFEFDAAIPRLAPIVNRDALRALRGAGRQPL